MKYSYPNRRTLILFVCFVYAMPFYCQNSDKGIEAIQCQYSDAWSFHEGLARIIDNKTELYGFINKTGEQVIPCKWVEAKDFSEGFAPVKNNDEKWGFIDKTGKLVIPCKWLHCRQFSGGLAEVEDSEKMSGFIDKTGNIVIPCQYAGGLSIYYYWAKDAYSFNENIARVCVDNKNRKFGYIGRTGELIIPYKWRYADHFSEGMAKVAHSNGLGGFIDQTGKVVIDYKWPEAYSFSEGRAAVKDADGKWGFIDRTGKVVIDCNWNRACPFSEGMAAVEDTDDKWGFIDKTGNVVIDCKWKHAFPFSEGMAVVEDADSKWGFIDKTGNVVIDCKWKGAFPFSEGMAMVKNEYEKYGYISNQLLSSKIVMNIDWLTFSPFIKEQKFNLRACIKSSKQIKKVDVYLNGQKVSGTRDMYVEKDDDCDYSVNQTLTLQPGKNIIKIEVTNTDGVSSEEKVVTYNPPTPAPVIPTEKRLALVIGNNKYTNTRCFPELRNAINDAKAVHARLKLLGFEVEPIVLDANKTAMWNAIENFINKAERYDVALIYYSGHGLSPDGGANYLIPTDANINYLDEIKKDGINSQTQLIARLEEKNCKVKIALLDCCNNCNVPERGTKSAVFHGGLSKMNPEGVFILHAASPGKKAEDGSGNNSPFVEALLECTDKYPNLLWESFVKKVRESVIQKTSERQKPYYEGVIDGEFYFNKK